MNNKVKYSILTIVIFLVVLGVVFILRNKEVKKIETEEIGEIKNKVGQIEEPVKVATSSDVENINMSNWEIYKNEEYGFEMKHPKEWIINSYYSNNKNSFNLGLGSPSSKSGGLEYGVTVYNNYDIEKLISVIGSQFNDRKEKREKIIFNNIEGLLITVTTKQYKDWVSKTIFILHNNSLFKISNGATLSSSYSFENFYQSFKFLK